MIEFPLYIILIPFAIIVLLFVVFAFFNLYHLFSYGFLSFYSFLITFIFLGMTVLILFITYQLALPLDWMQIITFP